MTPVSAGIVPCGRACILVFGNRDRGGRATGTQRLFEPFLDRRVMKGHFEQLRCGHLLFDRPSQKVAQMLARRGNQVRADQHPVGRGRIHGERAFVAQFRPRADLID